MADSNREVKVEVELVSQFSQTGPLAEEEVIKKLKK